MSGRRHGFTGMDFETAVRENIPILSIYSITSLWPSNYPSCLYLRKNIVPGYLGHYADMAKAFGGYGERVTDPNEIVAALNVVSRQRTAKPLAGIYYRPRNHYFQRITQPLSRRMHHAGTRRSVETRPEGMPTADNFQIIDIEVPEPQDGEFR